MVEHDAQLYIGVSKWLRAHGKTVKPRVTEEQRAEFQACFKLIDEDGSGAIDTKELENALRLLGIEVSRREVESLLREVDNDHSGDIGWQEFLVIMTQMIQRMSEARDEAAEAKARGRPASATAAGSGDDDGSGGGGYSLPFGLMATQYQRKRYMGALMGGGRDAVAGMVALAERTAAADLAHGGGVTFEAQQQSPRRSSTSGGALPDPSAAAAGEGLGHGQQQRLRAAGVDGDMLGAMSRPERKILARVVAKAEAARDAARARPAPRDYLPGAGLSPRQSARYAHAEAWVAGELAARGLVFPGYGDGDAAAAAGGHGAPRAGAHSVRARATSAAPAAGSMSSRRSYCTDAGTGAGHAPSPRALHTAVSLGPGSSPGVSPRRPAAARSSTASACGPSTTAAAHHGGAGLLDLPSANLSLEFARPGSARARRGSPASGSGARGGGAAEDSGTFDAWLAHAAGAATAAAARPDSGLARPHFSHLGGQLSARSRALSYGDSLRASTTECGATSPRAPRAAATAAPPHSVQHSVPLSPLRAPSRSASPSFATGGGGGGGAPGADGRRPAAASGGPQPQLAHPEGLGMTVHGVSPAPRPSAAAPGSGARPGSAGWAAFVVLDSHASGASHRPQ
ncbi:hypothetical protein FOA52_007355 [Chlamydomonas sp. UWO 241]|nr:hypothetical protein FOA52_007355 [Chlamydomonas sp. UWO 241]